MKVIDNVLDAAEFEEFVDRLNYLKDYMPCPHTDKLLPKQFKIEGHSIDLLRPRSNCFGDNFSLSLDHRNPPEILEPTDTTTVCEYIRPDIVKKLQHVVNNRIIPARIHDKAHHGQWITKKHLPASLIKILSHADTDYNGVEWWCYDSKKSPMPDIMPRIPRHFDYDGGLEILTGEKQPAEASVVYYHQIKDLSDGHLRFFEEGSDQVVATVEPKKNRLVVIPKGAQHDVTEFEGERVSFVFLLWKHRPVEFL
tara:strand:+ start:82 stop:840 length:759 start_codon:yes stop_codon:yes gene_type:complete